MNPSETLNKIVQLFKDECDQRHIEICPDLADFYIKLLACDAREGLDFQQLSACKIQRFLEVALGRYLDPNDPTMCNIKLVFHFKNFKEIDLNFAKEKYEKQSEMELQELIKGILQYPESSNSEQLEEMFTKMQVFIVANYNIGCPKNHVLLKQTRQSLNSVIGRGDLQKYVLKNREYRLEYLKRLGATVCGILIYNNHCPGGDKENMRDILSDLKMAKQHTKDSLENAIQNCQQYKKYGFQAIADIIHLDVSKKKAFCQLPITKVYGINKFVSLFSVFEGILRKLSAAFAKTNYLMDVGVGKMHCIFDKIDDILKYRTAIDSELIFPHFVHLSEIWSSLILYLNHTTEINKIRDKMDEIISPEVELSYATLLESTQTASVCMNYTIEPTFEDLITSSMKKPHKTCLLKIGENLKSYCGLTIALTGGLLVSSSVHKKLCEDLNVKFGFSNLEFAKYAERNFNEFICALKNVILYSVDLLLLFDVYKEVLEHDLQQKKETEEPTTKSLETQTEFLVENDLSIPNWINVTWNIWDYHRETIRLADLRKMQTHSAQTIVCYGQRNSQNQAFGNRHDV